MLTRPVSTLILYYTTNLELPGFQLFHPIGTQCVIGVQPVRAKARRKLMYLSLRLAFYIRIERGRSCNLRKSVISISVEISGSMLVGMLFQALGTQKILQWRAFVNCWKLWRIQVNRMRQRKGSITGVKQSDGLFCRTCG